MKKPELSGISEEASEIVQPELSKGQNDVWREGVYPLSWYEGTWLSLTCGYDSEDKDGYLKIKKVNDVYEVEQSYTQKLWMS